MTRPSKKNFISLSENTLSHSLHIGGQFFKIGRPSRCIAR